MTPLGTDILAVLIAVEIKVPAGAYRVRSRCLPAGPIV
jgi:hypothetical protein